MEQIKIPPDLEIRDMVISGLSLAVPRYLSRAEATERIRDWFPNDQLAVVALNRQITAQPIAA